jgi:hypothetical protein
LKELECIRNDPGYAVYDEERPLGPGRRVHQMGGYVIDGNMGYTVASHLTNSAPSQHLTQNEDQGSTTMMSVVEEAVGGRVSLPVQLLETTQNGVQVYQRTQESTAPPPNQEALTEKEKGPVDRSQEHGRATLEVVPVIRCREYWEAKEENTQVVLAMTIGLKGTWWKKASRLGYGALVFSKTEEFLSNEPIFAGRDGTESSRIQCWNAP